MRRAKDHFPGDKATHEWLNPEMKYATRAAYQTAWKKFLEFMGGKTGDQILAERKKDMKHLYEKKTLAFKAWLIKEKGMAPKTATTSAAAVRSFFRFHYVALEFRPAESQRLKEAKTVYEDYRFSKEDLAKMASVANLTEQYVLVAGKSFGLRVGDFLALTRGDLEAYIDRPVPISIGEIDTQKEGVSAFPMIDRDAQPIIKLMLKQMDREGRTDPSEPMLKYKQRIALSAILRRLAKRADIQIGSKRVRFHCLRKFLTDRLSSFMSESKWKQIVGKTISEGAYVSPDSLRKDYERVMDETCFAEMVSEEKIGLLAKKEAMKIAAKMAGYTDMEIHEIFRSRRVKTTGEQVKVLEELIEKMNEEKRKTETNGGCANDHNCQRIVSEEELPSLLAQGWKFVASLSDGKVVVEK